jgi:hypothetical protein
MYCALHSRWNQSGLPVLLANTEIRVLLCGVLFIYDLFNDVVSRSDYVARSVGWLVNN